MHSCCFFVFFFSLLPGAFPPQYLWSISKLEFLLKIVLLNVQILDHHTRLLASLHRIFVSWPEALQFIARLFLSCTLRQSEHESQQELCPKAIYPCSPQLNRSCPLTFLFPVSVFHVTTLPWHWPVAPVVTGQMRGILLHWCVFRCCVVDHEKLRVVSCQHLMVLLSNSSLPSPQSNKRTESKRRPVVHADDEGGAGWQEC